MDEDVPDNRDYFYTALEGYEEMPPQSVWVDVEKRSQPSLSSALALRFRCVIITIIFIAFCSVTGDLADLDSAHGNILFGASTVTAPDNSERFTGQSKMTGDPQFSHYKATLASYETPVAAASETYERFAEPEFELPAWQGSGSPTMLAQYTVLPPTALSPRPINPNDQLADQLTRFTGNKRSQHISFGAWFSPQFASYTLKDDDRGDSSTNAAALERSERHGFSFSTGAFVQLPLTHSFALRTGIEYSRTEITLDPQVLYAVADKSGNVKYRISTSSGYGYLLPQLSNMPVAGDSIYSESSIHSLQYLSFPITLMKELHRGKLSLLLGAGISANVLLHAKVSTVVDKNFRSENAVVNNLSGMKSVYFSGRMSAELDFKLSKRVTAIAAPTVSLAIDPISNGNAVRSYPKSFGLNLGTKVSF